MNRTARLIILAAVTLATAVAVLCSPAIPQNAAYHQFADQRTFRGVPNTFDVFSNIPFVLIGLLASWSLLFQRSRTVFTSQTERWLFVIFFIGAACVGFGSGYYHMAPDNDSLVWDRLPMTLGFMALVAALLAE
jgi:hypothetical protein